MDELKKLRRYLIRNMKLVEADNSCCGNTEYGVLWDVEMELDRIEEDREAKENEYFDKP